MNNVASDVGTAVHRLLKDPAVIPGFRAQFQIHERDLGSMARNINAAFLIAITGKRLSYPARGFLESTSKDDRSGRMAQFYLNALDRIEEELGDQGAGGLQEAARDLVRYLDTCPDMSSHRTLEEYWNLFFPEGTGLSVRKDVAVNGLREKRIVRIKGLNRTPVDKPHEQVLFTSNVLLTVPLVDDTGSLHITSAMVKALKSAAREQQVYWYDHPIPMGIETSGNEALYGLKALDQALRFEIDRQNAPADARVPVLLSVSTTHHGLQNLANEYLAFELEKAGGIKHLDIYAAAEKDVRLILDSVLLPAARHWLPDRDRQTLTDVLGVDGEYGRHYSFLKAFAALWQVLVDNRIKATFKIDLDQVFPQEVLVSETGKSAFEHLADPIWGAVATDSEGREVELGMLAGALVNESDIGDGLFTPDVKWPEGGPPAEQRFFSSVHPQALSTEAEMMARYGADGADGKTSCLQRVHVTGGTVGILIEHLRRHRPFTPGWIGRAEDQAYILSVLFPYEGPALRYAHASGLIMRHDKEDFAAEAVKAARIGKLVGDYVRILTFTSYARALPWEIEEIKEAVDPFTGCFISRLPVTVSCLRMALTAAGLFATGTDTDREDGVELIRVGSERLGGAMKELCDTEKVRDRLEREKEGWDLYYDALDALEKGLEEGDEFAESIREEARKLVEGWRI